MKRVHTYINARSAASKRDIVAVPLVSMNNVSVNDIDKSSIKSRTESIIDHQSNQLDQTKDTIEDYRITYENQYPETVIVKRNQRDKSSKLKHTFESDSILVPSDDINKNPSNKTITDDSEMIIDYITDRAQSEIDIDNNIRVEIDSFLIGLENRYTDQTPFRMWNRMYTIGLDIAVSAYSKRKVKKIILNALNESNKQLGTDALDEVRVYNKKKAIEYIQIGIEDGISSEYLDVYNKVLNGMSLIDVDQKTATSIRLGTMFSKYVDSAHPLDLEQFYNVGIMIANRPFNRERMIDKLSSLINERSCDEVYEIQQNKREQLLDSLNQGFQDSLDPKIRNGYDMIGKYNYDSYNRNRLSVRARIDGILARSKN